MQVKTIKTRIFKEKEDLFRFVSSYIKKLPEKSVVVVTSKIAALSQGRTIEIPSGISRNSFRAKIIEKESEFKVKTDYAWMTLKDNTVMASAGIDESNANGKIILLPKDSYKVAHEIRKKLKNKFKIKDLGVIITDSRTIPLRSGVVGVALGYAGFHGVRDYRGTKDIFNRKLKISRTNLADSLATAAVLCMGEGSERLPLAVIEKAPVEFTEKTNKKELYIDPQSDIYLPFFEGLKKRRK